MRAVETFVKMGTSIMDSMSGRESFSNAMMKNELTSSDIILLFVYIAVILMFGKYLWNEVACKYVTVVKPLSSVWQLIGLSILVQLFF